MCLIYLTRHPKTWAGEQLRDLVRGLHQIKTFQEKDKCIREFNSWNRVWDKFLKQKSESPSGRKWYTHKLLRRARSLIQNALPDMFHYLENSKIPKSTNGLETKFSYLKNNLKIHRGLIEKNRKKFILWYNYFKYN
ncbi:hypothetical protein ACFL23_00540 [Patescibacteria group bacterium]